LAALRHPYFLLRLPCWHIATHGRFGAVALLRLQVQPEYSEKRKDHQNEYDDNYQAERSNSSPFVSS
jgi:hypothetical protein